MWMSSNHSDLFGFSWMVFYALRKEGRIGLKGINRSGPGSAIWRRKVKLLDLW